MILKIGNDASYLYVNGKPNDKVKETKLVDENIVIDYCEDGSIFGIEILSKLDIKYYNDYKGKKL